MLVCRAPGKVILFGEHAVVFGIPAIAASVGLYTYIYVTPPAGAADLVQVEFPEVGLSHTWKRAQLPRFTPNLHHALDTEALEAIAPHLEGIDGVARAAALSFLYLYCHLCPYGAKFTAHSELPVGAGLGSSASFSVALVAALLAHAGDHPSLETINTWAFIGESCIHGTPSGIDNVVATLGGAVHFIKSPQGPRVTPLKMHSLELVLTNTKVPRSTKLLVEGVAALKQRFPAIVEPILASIEALVQNAHELLESQPADLAAQLGEFVRINHSLLSALGVSHQSLETVCAAAQRTGLGSTKLTGAGGGGCAITIVENKKAEPEFAALLEGMSVFATSLGGQGASYASCENLDANFASLEYTSFN